MRTTATTARKPSPRRILIASLLLLLTAASVNAADYFVFGRVYTATPLAAGEEPPTNPLTGVPDDQIIGENLLAQVPRNLVKVRVISAVTGNELGSHITENDGAYLISFNITAASVSARFVVEEIATSKVLVDSIPVTLDAWPTPNIKYVLIEEDLAEISSDREFATGTTPPQHTGIFTRVGKIEVQTEDPPGSGTQVHLIDPVTGEATVTSAVSADLHIPAYQNAAFGGNLYLFGALSQELYTIAETNPDLCYKIEIEDTATSTTWDFNDSLVKTKYTVDFTTGTVDTERITLGPQTLNGVTNCYRPTPLSSGNEFWSFPDLLGLWRTGARDGTYTLTLDVKNLSGPDVFVDVALTTITLRVDNNPPVAQILPLMGTSPPEPDTPRVYTPGAVPTTTDLTPTLLESGTYPANYGGVGDPTCEIFNIEPPPDKYITFKLTAHQPNGYLRQWSFYFERNDKNNQTLLGKQYNGTAVMTDLSGVAISSSETATSGFENLFLYVDSAHLDQVGGPVLPDCAYRFVISAWRRVTDGYHYLSSRWDQDLHYVQK